MDILIGLLIIAIGSFCQSSSYVPIKKVKEWSWESFWLIQGVFAWLVFPFLGSLLGVPQGGSLLDLWGAGGAGMSIFYGILWGVGGLTFGLSMRYLGVALGQSISLGTCALVDLIVQVHFFYDGFHQTFGIRRIVNRKIGSKTQRLSLGPQYP